MDEKGDIPERNEISLEVNKDYVSNEAKRKISALKTLATDGKAQAHFYLPNMPDGEDVHLEARFAHFFVEEGYVYWHANDRDRWAFGDDIIMIESHYED
jgi:uncharacterized protein YqjF (DUF2071 family)